MKIANLFSADGSNNLVEFKQTIEETKKIKQSKPIPPMKEKLKPGPKPILTEEQKAENRRIANAKYREKNQDKMKDLKAKWYKNNSEYAKKKSKEKYQEKTRSI